MIRAFKITGGEIPLMPVKWGNLESKLKVSLRKYLEWYDGNDVTILGDNLLYNILSMTDMETNNTLGLFARSIIDNTDGISVALRLTSLAKGELHDNVFVDTKVAMLVENDVLPHGKWEDVKPVNILEHTSVNMDFFDLTTGKVSDNTVLCSVNILSLAYGYRGYRTTRFAQGLHASIGHYLAKYVYPKMMVDYINLVLVNIYINPFGLNVDKPETDTLGNMPLKDESANIVKVFIEHSDNMFKSHRTFGFYLDSIPIIGGIFTNQLALADNGNSSNIATFEVAARFRVFSYIKDNMNESAYGYNKSVIVNAWTLVKRLDANGYLAKSDYLTADQVKEIRDFIKEVE